MAQDLRSRANQLDAISNQLDAISNQLDAISNQLDAISNELEAISQSPAFRSPMSPQARLSRAQLFARTPLRPAGNVISILTVQKLL